MSDCDVLIVGGGPVGLYTAIQLGKRALLIEKGDLPQMKSCAGGLTPWMQARMHEMGFNGPSHIYHHLHCYFSRGCRILEYAHSPMQVVLREVLSSFLWRRARDAGAEILCLTKLTDLDLESKVATIISPQGASKVSYRVLIGADGAASKVAAQLGLNRQVAFMRTIQYRLRQPGFDQLASGWAEEFGPNFAWAFAMPPFVNVGIGGPPPGFDLKPRLETWFRRLDIPMPSPEHKAENWLVPYTWRGILHPHDVYLVGDAAGAGSGLTGEGLHQGFLTADAAVRRTLDPSQASQKMLSLLRQKRWHERFLQLRAASPALSRLSNEMLWALTGTRWGADLLVGFFGMAPLRNT